MCYESRTLTSQGIDLTIPKTLLETSTDVKWAGPAHIGLPYKRISMTQPIYINST